MAERDSQKNKKYIQLIDRAQGVVDKILNITSWCTNVSLALIGFHIALLLQLKFWEWDIISFLTIIPLVTLGISIIIGLVLKFWYQAVEIAQDFIRINDDAIEILDLPDEVIEELKENDKVFDKILGLKLERWPILWIVTQNVLFLISLVMVSIYLIRVLFI